MTITPIPDLTDGDAALVVQSLMDIMKLADQLSRNSALNLEANLAKAHEIYVRARDARDAMLFDQVTRETVARLSSGTSVVAHGMRLSEQVVGFLRAGQLINAIKELRTDTGCGLKEAKDACEYARDHLLKL